MNAKGSPVISTAETNLFDGSLGVICALQAAESALGSDNEFHSPERTDHLNRFSDELGNYYCKLYSNAEFPRGNAGLTGLGGDALGLAILSQLDGTRWSWTGSALERIVSKSAAYIDDDENIDVMSGISGMALGFSAAWNHVPDKVRKNIAALGYSMQDKLVASFGLFDEQFGWLVPGEQLPLWGYAHGFAGVFSGFIQLSSQVCQFGRQDSAREFIKRCQTLLAVNISEEFIRDNRGGLGSSRPMGNSWCNGWSGFTHALRHLRDEKQIDQFYCDTLDKLIASAPEATSRFCCGEFGKIDAIWAAGACDVATMKADLEARDFISKLGRRRDLHRYEDDFFGLYQGMSGVAYSLARVLNPRTPSLSGVS